MDLGRGSATPARGGGPIVVRISEFTITGICSAVSAVHRCRADSVGRWQRHQETPPAPRVIRPTQIASCDVEKSLADWSRPIEGGTMPSQLGQAAPWRL
jgi:hypothetical protein